MEKNNHKNGDAQNAVENFFVVTEFVSPLQQQLLNHKILLANTPADAMNQTELDHNMQLLRLLEHLVEAEKQQQPHYAVSRLVAADVAAGGILSSKSILSSKGIPSLGNRIETEDAETEDAEKEQPSKLVAMVSHLSHVFDLNTPFADLLEERTSKAAEIGEFAAKWWYTKQLLMTAPQLLFRAGRNLTKGMNRNLLKGSGGGFVETIFINVLATLLVALLAELLRHFNH